MKIAFDLGLVRFAPYAMRIAPEGPVREPDLLFLTKENMSRRTEKLLLGPADLVIEIVSTDSVHRDRDVKYHEYAQGGVCEYWVIDPRQGRRADFYRLLPEGRYELFATEDDERVESAVLPGFWLKPAWLWEAEERDPLATLMEIRGVPPEAAAQIQAILRGDQG
jgi:Uma2 family endonuclease